MLQNQTDHDAVLTASSNLIYFSREDFVEGWFGHYLSFAYEKLGRVGALKFRTTLGRGINLTYTP